MDHLSFYTHIVGKRQVLIMSRRRHKVFSFRYWAKFVWHLKTYIWVWIYLWWKGQNSNWWHIQSPIMVFVSKRLDRWVSRGGFIFPRVVCSSCWATLPQRKRRNVDSNGVFLNVLTDFRDKNNVILKRGLLCSNLLPLVWETSTLLQCHKGTGNGEDFLLTLIHASVICPIRWIHWKFRSI